MGRYIGALFFGVCDFGFVGLCDVLGGVVML
jgi:hypothetical protein